METTKHISDLFGQYGKSGWVCKILTSTQIMSGFTGSAGKFSLYVEIKEGWLLFVVSDFLDVTGTKISFEDIYRLLLQLNGRIYGVKLALDEKGQVILVCNVEYDEQVAVAEFNTAIDLLTYYADDLYTGLRERLFGQEGKAPA